MKNSNHYILCADDDEMNLTLLEIYLSDNYEVKMVKDGQACLDAVAERKPNLILLDLMMPVLSGKDVFKRLKASSHTSDIPIIVLSANSFPNDVNIMRDLGVNDYLTKPFDEAQLVRVVEACLP